MGRGGGMSRASALRLTGRAYEDTLARELGRDDSDSSPLLLLAPPPRLGRGPNDKRLTPDVDRRGTCLLPAGREETWLAGVGVASSPLPAV